MEGEERDRGFTVKDRRRFSADGEARDEQDSNAAGPEQPTDAPSGSSPPPAADPHPHDHSHDHSDPDHSDPDHSHSDPDHTHSDPDHTHSHDHEHPGDHPHQHAEITFATFIISLSAQALALLGEIPDPVSRATEVDLEGARQIIDILGILSEKTRGNLDAAETSLIDNALFDLRMKYVDRVQGR